MFGKKKKQTVPELEQQIRRGEVSLFGLDIPDFSQIDWSKPIEVPLEQEFRDKVRWSLTADESDRLFINRVIYEGGTVQIMGRLRHSQKTYNEMLELRMHELYGVRYDELRRHPEGDRRVCELLLEESPGPGNRYKSGFHRKGAYGFPDIPFRRQ